MKLNECVAQARQTPKLLQIMEQLSEIRSALSAEADATGSALNKLSRNETPSKMEDIKLIDAHCFSSALEQEIQLLANVLERLNAANRGLHDLV